MFDSIIKIYVKKHFLVFYDAMKNNLLVYFFKFIKRTRMKYNKWKIMEYKIEKK